MSDKPTDGAPFLLRFLHGLWRRVVPVFIGMFFLWQCWHMLVDNFTHGEDATIDLLKNYRKENPDDWERVRKLPDGDAVEKWLDPPDEPNQRTLHNKIEFERKFHRWYGQLVGQEQAWSLFAPNVVKYSCFVAVQLRWDDPARPQPEWLEDAGPVPAAPSRGGGGEVVPVPLPGDALEAPAEAVREPVLILSDNEPRDVHAYLRIGKFRYRRFEGNIQVSMYRNKGESWAEYLLASAGCGLAPGLGVRCGYLDRWADRIGSRVRGDGDCMYAYMRWRLRQWREENPGVPEPTQVVLLSRTYVIPELPGPQPWDWEFQGMRPIVRWLPGERSSARIPLHRYQPASGTYERE